jgi:hypothetical protein
MFAWNERIALIWGTFRMVYSLWSNEELSLVTEADAPTSTFGFSFSNIGHSIPGLMIFICQLASFARLGCTVCSTFQFD